MQHARRQLFRRRVGRGEAEHIGVGDRLGAQSDAEHVADDAAQPGVRSAVRLDRAGPIVRLDFEANVVLVIEAHDAGVVRKDADAPIVVAESPANFLRGGEDRLLEQVVVACARRA